MSVHGVKVCCWIGVVKSRSAGSWAGCICRISRARKEEEVEESLQEEDARKHGDETGSENGRELMSQNRMEINIDG